VRCFSQLGHATQNQHVIDQFLDMAHSSVPIIDGKIFKDKDFKDNYAEMTKILEEF